MEFLRHVYPFPDAARLVFRVDTSVRGEIEKPRHHRTGGQQHRLFHRSPHPFPAGGEVDILMVGTGDHLGSIPGGLQRVASEEESACGSSFHQSSRRKYVDSVTPLRRIRISTQTDVGQAI